MAVVIDQALLNSYEGKNISAICAQKYNDNGLNHCAHFVSHVLTLNFDYTCDKQVKGASNGANIRVQEVYAKCSACYPSKPKTFTCGLIFATTATAKPSAKYMPNIKNKHVGIYINGLVTHYSNTKDYVVVVSEAEFKSHYGAKTNVYYADFPETAVATRLAG